MSVNEKKLLARMRAVKGIARRAGYPEYKAEDIAQQVAISACEGRNQESQTNYQSFVDALRDGSERAYTRSGCHVVSLFESQFEDYSSIVNKLRFENNIEDSEIYRIDIFDIVSAITKIEQTRQQAVILYFYYGWTLDQISKQAGVSASRIGQKLTDAVKSIKKNVISSRLSQDEQAERKREEFRALSQKEERCFLDGKEKKEVEGLRKNQRIGLGQFAVEKIPETLLEPFRVAAF